MKILWATIIKELILLRRDRAGLIFLFLMPGVLVLVITLVQQNVLSIIGETKTSILLLDLDSGDIGETIATSLEQSGNLAVIRHETIGIDSEKAAMELVSDGRYKACVVIAPGLSETVRTAAGEIIDSGFTGNQPKFPEPQSEVKIYFDPTVLSGFRSGISGAVQMAVRGIETGEKIQALLRTLPTAMEKQMTELLGPSMSGMIPKPELQFTWNNDPLITVGKLAASRRGMAHFPSPVQQNVPAYALFGIFFIVLPLAGSLLKERQDGLMGRLLTMPVPVATLIGGKIAAYLLVCFCQFGFIVLIGKTVLPALGTDSLDLGPNLGALAAICLSAALAANGYGILLGALCRTFRQVSTVGPISVVIAAALGGIMVPVHAMPEIMQKISLISPLGWGLEAFLEITIRNGSFHEIMLEINLLLSFFILTCAIGITVLLSRVRNEK